MAVKDEDVLQDADRAAAAKAKAAAEKAKADQKVKDDAAERAARDKA